MEDYTLRKLEGNNLKEFKFIAEIHESLPGAWIDNYTIDYEEIGKTVKSLVEKHKTGNILCYIAENNSKVIAFIWAEINENDKDVLDIFSLWTNQRYRGQGIATNLKIELERWAKAETNAKKISTTISAYNKNILLLNQKLGYEIKYHKMIKVI